MPITHIFLLYAVDLLEVKATFIHNWSIFYHAPECCLVNGGGHLEKRGESLAKGHPAPDSFLQLQYLRGWTSQWEFQPMETTRMLIEWQWLKSISLE